VVALFIPGICGAQYHRRAVEAASGLLQSVGYGESRSPWLAIGGAVNSGMTFVGNVGGEGIVDFTALGDTVNTASRLASSAAAGEILLSETVYVKAAEHFPNLRERTLALRGKELLMNARVLEVA
jgi:adenylate cyclase